MCASYSLQTVFVGSSLRVHDDEVPCSVRARLRVWQGGDISPVVFPLGDGVVRCGCGGRRTLWCTGKVPSATMRKYAAISSSRFFRPSSADSLVCA